MNDEITILDTAAAIKTATGLDPLTPRWEATLRLFYGLPLRDVDIENLAGATQRSESALRALQGQEQREPFRELWCRVGRRGRKSVTSALVAVFESAFGGHEKHLIPGERGFVAVISRDTAGAALVARFAELHAQALGFQTNWTTIGATRVLELPDTNFAIVSLACNVRAPRGWPLPVVVCDELAFWTTEDQYANPDREVLAAVRPGQAQFPNAKLIAISSPFGVEGLHHETIETNLGDDAAPGVLAVTGPTWEWNPEITEERTRELETDPKNWSREFLAQPGVTVSSAFDPADVEASFQVQASGLRRDAFVAIDASSLRGDGFTWIAGFETNAHELVVTEVGGWQGDDLKRVTMSEIVSTISQRAKALGTNTIFGDQREEAALRALFAQHRVHLETFAWSEGSKDESVMMLRRMMRERRLSLYPHEELRQELVTMKARLLPSGKTHYSTNGLDFASALVTLGHAAVDGRLGQASMLATMDRQLRRPPDRMFPSRRDTPPDPAHPWLHRDHPGDPSSYRSTTALDRFASRARRRRFGGF